MRSTEQVEQLVMLVWDVAKLPHLVCWESVFLLHKAHSSEESEISRLANCFEGTTLGGTNQGAAMLNRQALEDN